MYAHNHLILFTNGALNSIGLFVLGSALSEGMILFSEQTFTWSVTLGSGIDSTSMGCLEQRWESRSCSHFVCRHVLGSDLCDHENVA